MRSTVDADLPALRSFTTGLRRDPDAVIAGLTMGYNSGAVAILDDLVGDDPHPSIPPGSRDQPFAVNDRIVWFWTTLREAEAAALSFDPGILLGVVAGLVDSDVCQAARSTAAA